MSYKYPTDSHARDVPARVQSGRLARGALVVP